MTSVPKTRIPPRLAPSVADVRASLAACRHDPVLHAGAALMLFAGLRPGEVRRMLVQDWLPGEAPRVVVRGGVAARMIRVAPSAATALYDSLIGEDTEPDEPLILGLTQRGWLEKVFSDVAQDACLDVRVHDLRQAAIAAALEDGTPVAHVEAYFGLSKAVDRRPPVGVPDGYDAGVAAALEVAFAG
ncbi:hypothetical protein [Streptomyces niveus]|uniref:hypothetical protein n=1 Tax=Streptomyces niveus TaxID=193462 RepID=UPI00342A2A95